MTATLETGFYFSVAIAGLGTTDAAFQEVSGISKSTGTEDVVCGGENRFKYRLPSVTTFENLVLKRGVVVTESPLIMWVKDILDDGLANSISPKDINVTLLNADGNPSMTWTFINAYPVKWRASDLKSQNSEVFIETLEFAYQYFDIDDARDAAIDLFGDA